MTKTPFPCNACGHCCRNVHLSVDTNFLNRGDGVCRFFEQSTQLCNIYDTRPLVCRVEEYYDTYLADHYTWDGFVKMNMQICQKLQGDEKLAD